ncbi:multi-sensor hybrid histidine kinase [hydrothermal vent metagenome]|uniref:Multi-sensor hybrid histidine kinase n=1 Tax=hydrothermal vent metagenome TaxID=652676 RepID=A0A1W1CVJ9_9ZZZZ
MKHITFLYNENRTYKKAVKEAKKNIYTERLIQIFTSQTDKKEIQKILNRVAKDFPKCQVVGTTTAGEITHAKMYDKETVISLSLFKKTKIKIQRSKTVDKRAGKALSLKLCAKDTKALIILSEGLLGEDYEGFIKGIKKVHPKVIIAGGLAGDNFALQKTYIFIGTKIYDKGVLGVSFSGDKLFASNAYNLNWHPIGKEFRVTSVKGNLLQKIDNEDAVTTFKKYLGDEIFKNNAASLPDFQLLYKEGDTVVSRTPMAREKSAIVLAAPIKKGQKFQFGFSNAASVMSGADKISAKFGKNPAEAIYIYSCIARKTLLGKSLESEFKPLESIAPTAGFFTYGEFYSTNKNNALLNCTTTVLVLSESKKSNTSRYISRKQKNLESITFDALTHFIEQTARELQENTQLLEEYKTAVDYTALVSKTDINGTITYVNDNFVKVSKYSKAELLGKDHNIVRDPSTSSFVFKKLWTTILAGKVWRGILPNRAKDGSIYYVDATIMPIIDEQNRIKEFIAIRQDITKQIEAKKRIQEKERLIKAIFDNQDSIVIYASKTKGMLNVNKKLFETFAYKSFEEFKSKNSCICDLFLEEDGYVNTKKYPNWMDDIAANKLGSQVKVKMITRDKRAHTFVIMVKKNGEDEYIINLNDITELEDAILKAYASEQAKSIFLANMSHEIRTPLNGILGFTDVLRKRDLDRDAKKYIEIIHKSGQTLLNVVNDILDFSKIESGELRLSPVEANLFAEIEAAVATFSSLFKQKHLYYYTYIDSALPKSLLCDVQRIKQVLNNLISNAVKFTPENGDVSVSVELRSVKDGIAKIHFSVRDSGIGIPEEKIKTIFEPFSQADDSISRKFGGTGLGLAISNQYVKMMGSKIELISEEGRGSNFFFDLELPIIDAHNSLEIKEHSVNICVLSAKNDLNCAINEIIFSYLKSWKYSYVEIETLDMITENTDILIVCSQLFDAKTCKNALDKYPKLQLIYIEGIDEHFSCTHEKFHFIEQPMTGSALFDKLITLINSDQKPLQTEGNTLQETLSYKGNVLVAEDNETNQMLISIMLEERGIDFTIVNNGEEAIDAARKDDFDIIFMDINMPILDGMSATKSLRASGYNKPIVSLSANVIESDKKMFLEAGVDDTLNKPIVPDALDKILTKYLRNEKKAQNVVYDEISVEKIAKSLKINNEAIVKKLLGSFYETLIQSIKEMQTNGLNRDNLHKLKGVTGNLRLNVIYNLAIKFEDEVQGWSQEENERNTQMIIEYARAILRQLDDILGEK